MRTWTKSACVVLAWSILPVTVVAAGMTGSARPAQANTRIASNTEVTLTSTLSAAAVAVTAANPTTRYVVQPGDTLSGIAAQFAVRGGWPALYAANRRAIGPDPDLIRPGTVLTLPRPAVPSLLTPGSAHRRQHPPAPSPSPPTPRHHLLPRTKQAPPATGMPPWLQVMLLAGGLLLLAAFLTERGLGVRRRRQQAAAQALRQRQLAAAAHDLRQRQLAAAVQALRQRQHATSQALRRRQHATSQALELGTAGVGPGPGSRRPGTADAGKVRIILAGHGRLVVTCDKRDDTVCVLRPPGADAKAILRAARLVLPESRYAELADQLGMPASWPME